jgi:hypothetical protein
MSTTLCEGAVFDRAVRAELLFGRSPTPILFGLTFH